MKDSFKIIEIIYWLVVFIAVCLLEAWPLMWLWNWLMPYLFGLPVINFWKALGISLLASMIFPHNTSSRKS
jgi:hypothetical protein